MKKTVVFGVVLSKTNTSPPFSDADDVDESISSLESEFTMPRTSKTTGLLTGRNREIRTQIILCSGHD